MSRRTVDPWPDAERLDLFIDRAEALMREPAVSTFKLDVGFTLKAEQGGPMSAEFREPPETALRSYLLAFRPFMSNDDPLYVDGIHNLLHRAIRGDPLKEKLGSWRSSWQNNRKLGAMRLELNGAAMTPARALDLWINGYYFHNDRAKAAELRRLSGIDGGLVRHAALDLVVEGSRYVQFLGWAIVFGRREGVLSI